MRRHGLSDVLDGAYVFPGGKVDATDALLDTDTHLDQTLPVLRVICYPGDERHSVQTRVMVGPTRLIYRNKRFEPVTGFEGLLD